MVGSWTYSVDRIDADKLNGFLETSAWAPNCEYMNACIQFKNSLCLPGKLEQIIQSFKIT